MATHSIKDAFNSIMANEYNGEPAIRNEMFAAVDSLFDDGTELVCPNTENWMGRKAEIGMFAFLIHNIAQYKKFVNFNFPNFGELADSGFLCTNHKIVENRKTIHGFMHKDKFILALASLPQDLQMIVNFTYLVKNDEIKKYPGCNFTIDVDVGVESLLPADMILLLHMGIHNKYFKKTLMQEYFLVSFAMETEENIEDVVLNMIYGEQIVENAEVESNYEHFHSILKMIYVINSIPEQSVSALAVDITTNPQNYQYQMQFAAEQIHNDYTNDLIRTNCEELDQLINDSGLAIVPNTVQPPNLAAILNMLTNPV